jgi:hypothetical protein
MRHRIGHRIDRAAPGDADAVAVSHHFEEDARREAGDLGFRGLRGVADHPDRVEAEGVLDLAGQAFLPEQLRRSRDVDDAGLPRPAQIERDRSARDVQPLRNLVLPQAVRVVEPCGLVDDLVSRTICHLLRSCPTYSIHVDKSQTQ